MTSDYLIGQHVGNYQIERLIAQGGFGSVYLGRHVIFEDRPLVAIKLLHAHLASQVEYDRFLLEARLLEKLKHPFILPLIDAGIEHNLPYIIAEYASHGSLLDRMKLYAPHPLPINEVLSILSQVGQALQYAHQVGVIHRDLKPVNILFKASGDALLADFGIAAVSDLARTTVVDATGTPPYMAPEQFAFQASRQSDQYALACIAYELFTGHKIFDVSPVSNNMLWMQSHLQETPRPLTFYNAALPLHIEQAVLKALSKERRDRYPDIAAFIQALQAPTHSLPPTLSVIHGGQQPLRLGYQPALHNGQTALAPPPVQGQVQSMVQPVADSFVQQSPIPAVSPGILKWLAILCYLPFGLGGPLVLLFKTNQPRFLRFHAWQATFLCLFYIALTAWLTRTWPFLSHERSTPGFVLNLIMLIFIIVLIPKVFAGKYAKVPLLGYLASVLSHKKAFYNVQHPQFAPSSNPNTPAYTPFSERLAAALSYSLFFVSGFIFLLCARKSRFVRFHAWQSVIFLGLMALLSLVSYNLLLPVLLAGWLIGIIQAFRGRYYQMPLIGKLVAIYMSRHNIPK